VSTRIIVVVFALAFAGTSLGAVAADSTPPVITYAFAGTPGNDGWFRSDVTVRWYVSDPESIYSAGIECLNPAPMVATGETRSCSATSAGGAASITTPPVKIDKVPPTLTRAEVKKGDRFVTLSWAATGGVAAVSVSRADLAAAAAAPAMYTGTGTSYTDRSVKNGVKYSYVLKVEDVAGNAVTRTMAATPRPALYQPARDARIRRGAATTFAWEAVPKSTYYNFQLHRRVGGRWVKVLTSWPAKPWFALPRRWQGADGTTTTLTAGRYRWYVWPATGLRSQRRYGKLEGSSEFSVG
jgi:hypothetical protein